MVYRDKTPISVHDLDDGLDGKEPQNMVDLEDRDDDDEYVEDMRSHRPGMEAASSNHAPAPGRDGDSRSAAGSVMRSGARDPRSNRRVTLLQFEETVAAITANIAEESERSGMIETKIFEIKEALAQIDKFMKA